MRPARRAALLMLHLVAVGLLVAATWEWLGMALVVDGVAQDFGAVEFCVVALVSCWSSALLGLGLAWCRRAGSTWRSWLLAGPAITVGLLVLAPTPTYTTSFSAIESVPADWQPPTVTADVLLVLTAASVGVLAALWTMRRARRPGTV